MAQKQPLLETLSLKGLEIAPSQVWGAVRIVPLLRRQPRSDLRLFKRRYKSDVTVVNTNKKAQYVSYVPHGLVMDWTEDKSDASRGAEATIGEQLLTEGRQFGRGPARGQVLERMVKRESKQSLRLLPMHMAMEGFLAMYFRGPSTAWAGYYNRETRSRGLSPRVETSISGQGIVHLDRALRLFEIHEDQVGVLLFISERLASAFVVPTPEDYRLLHSSLLADFYGETFYYYGLYGATAELRTTIDAAAVDSLADLERELGQMRSHWADFQGFMADDLLERKIESQRIYTAGPFSLQRFITDLSKAQDNYIGETIADDRSQLQYLKIYSLSAAQTKRAFLLKHLAAHDWHLERAAKAQGDSLEALVTRLENVGFGYLLNNQLREQTAKAMKAQQGK